MITLGYKFMKMFSTGSQEQEYVYTKFIRFKKMFNWVKRFKMRYFSGEEILIHVYKFQEKLT